MNYEMPEFCDHTEDNLLAGRVRLVQMRRGHRAGTDAVLLAAAVAAIDAEIIVDVGAATGAVGLMIGVTRPDAHIVMIEKDRALAELCRKNIELNDMALRARVIVADVLESDARIAGIKRAGADLVVSNPPFIEEGSARLSPDERRRNAHALPPGGLEAWIRFCTGLLKPNGTLVLIHRADRLPDCLRIMSTDMGAFRIRMIHSREGENATRVLIAAARGRKTPAIVEAPLFLHDCEGGFTAEAAAMHCGEW